MKSATLTCQLHQRTEHRTEGLEIWHELRHETRRCYGFS